MRASDDPGCPRIRSWYGPAMAVLLLTGATGMVGREVLARVATDERYDRVLCLVRPSAEASAQQRLKQLCRQLDLPSTVRVRAVAGDVTQTALGLSGRTLAGVTDVIHCAATVSFDNPLAEAREINVAGTRNVLAAARRMRRLERVDAVSTCYVAGQRTGLVLESDLEHTAGFHNTYEQTKYESELVLRDAMADLPIAVHRPSIVVGDSRTGRAGAWKVLYWPLKVIANGWLPVMPYDPTSRLDIVPVDFVADALLALSRDPSTLGGTFHLAAGPGRDTTAGELVQLVFRMLDRRPPFGVPPVLFRTGVRPLLMLTPSRRIHRTLKSGLVYRPYLELDLQFDTHQADRHLHAAGVSCPAVTDYIETVVRVAIASDFGRRPSDPVA